MSMTKEQAIKLLEHPIYKWSMDWDEREDGLNYTSTSPSPPSTPSAGRLWSGYGFGNRIRAWRPGKGMMAALCTLP